MERLQHDQQLRKEPGIEERARKRLESRLSFISVFWIIVSCERPSSSKLFLSPSLPGFFGSHFLHPLALGSCFLGQFKRLIQHPFFANDPNPRVPRAWANPSHLRPAGRFNIKIYTCVWDLAYHRNQSGLWMYVLCFFETMEVRET